GAEKVTRDLGDEPVQLGSGAEIDARLLAIRKRALQARLNQARESALALWSKDRYQALAEEVAKWARQREGEARAVGMQAELEKFRATWDAVLALARQAGKLE